MQVFNTAAKDGLVDDLVVRRLQSSLTKQELEELFSSNLLEDGRIILERLPNEWKRNVQGSRGDLRP